MRMECMSLPSPRLASIARDPIPAAWPVALDPRVTPPDMYVPRNPLLVRGSPSQRPVTGVTE